MSESSFTRRGVVAVIPDGRENRGDRPIRYLVIERSQTVIAPGTLCFPGGGIEGDETPEEAVVRECLEEIGAVVEPVQRIWENVTPWNVHLIWFLAHLKTPRPEILINKNEVAAIAWMTFEELMHHPKLLQSNLPFLMECGIDHSSLTKSGGA